MNQWHETKRTIPFHSLFFILSFYRWILTDKIVIAIFTSFRRVFWVLLCLEHRLPIVRSFVRFCALSTLDFKPVHALARSIHIFTNVSIEALRSRDQTSANSSSSVVFSCLSLVVNVYQLNEFRAFLAFYCSVAWLFPSFVRTFFSPSISFRIIFLSVSFDAPAFGG